MVYISEGVSEIYLSKRACKSLGLVSQWFPIAADTHSGRSFDNHDNVYQSNSIEMATVEVGRKECLQQM